MILDAQPKQFTLKDDGKIYFQENATNPLPGIEIARVLKGKNILQPDVEVLDVALPGGEDKAAIADHLNVWVKAHVYTVLEPLFNLVADETLAEPVRGIGLKLFESMGITPRTQLEDLITALDADGRKALRDKKVKLGPLLVFLPDLNKPAAVRVRGLLWSLFNEKELPAPTPRDGATSVAVEEGANPEFYKTVGYPVYGPRAIRIDMLDRVINAIYDSANGGKFRADHKMAEWMGCGIEQLYAVLEAMGHKRIKVETPVESVAQVKAEEPAAEAPVQSAEAAPAPEVKKEKPLLDEFYLRKGQAHKERAERPVREFKKKEWSKDSRPSKPNDIKKFGEDRPKFDKKKYDKKKDFKDKKDEPRVFAANAKLEDSPFAVLSQLKK